MNFGILGAGSIAGIMAETIQTLNKSERKDILNRPLSSRQEKKEKLRQEGLVPISNGSQTL